MFKLWDEFKMNLMSDEEFYAPQTYVEIEIDEESEDFVSSGIHDIIEKAAGTHIHQECDKISENEGQNAETYGVTDYSIDSSDKQHSVKPKKQKKIIIEGDDASDDIDEAFKKQERKTVANLLHKDKKKNLRISSCKKEEKGQMHSKQKKSSNKTGEDVPVYIKDEYHEKMSSSEDKKMASRQGRPKKNIDKIAEVLAEMSSREDSAVKRGRPSKQQPLKNIVRSSRSKRKSPNNECKKCGKSFNIRINLEQHLVIFHGEERPFECDRCKRKFYRKIELEKHEIVHSVTSSHKCSVCGIRFNKINILANHLAVHKNLTEYSCQICQNKYVKLSALKRHILTHTGTKNHQCHICERKFLWPWHLTSHVKTHSGVKPFKCDVCGKDFTKKSDVKRHQDIHEGTRQFECDMCGKKFLRAGNLKSHEEIHTTDLKFDCELCDSKFLRPGNLKRHMISHTNLKPHECNMCSKAFKLRHHLKRHLLKIHDIVFQL